MRLVRDLTETATPIPEAAVLQAGETPRTASLGTARALMWAILRYRWRLLPIATTGVVYNRCACRYRCWN